jgi:hypothetical protein
MMNNMFPYVPWRGHGHLNSDASQDTTHRRASPDVNTITRQFGTVQESPRHARQDYTLRDSRYRHEIYCLAARIGYAILTGGRGFM